MLLVESLTCQRVQDVSEEQAKTMGAYKVYEAENGGFYHPESETVKVVGDYGDYKTGYKAIYISLYGTDSYERNDYIWTYKVKVLSKTGMPDNLNQ